MFITSKVNVPRQQKDNPCQLALFCSVLGILGSQVAEKHMAKSVHSQTEKGSSLHLLVKNSGSPKS